jgi:hypothetical protein
MVFPNLLRSCCRVVVATALMVLACAGVARAQTSVTLAWNANSEADLAGYRVEYGTVSGSPTTTVDVGNVIQRQFSGLQTGLTYYFRVKAYNTANEESVPSAEVSYTVPSPAPPPTLTAVSPASGPVAGGTAITLTGTNFVSGATVTVGGVAATSVTVVSSTSITAGTPAGTAGARDVRVTTSAGSATRTGGFTYNAPPAPSLSSVSPTTGPFTGGTVITINGANFVSGTGGAVRVGGVACTNVTFVSSTQLRATTPAGTPGAQTVQVTNPDGQSGSLASAYTYTVPAPTLTAVSPTSGPTTGGTAITLTGTNFVAGASVTVGGAAATSVTVVSTTSITAFAPAGTAGARDVRVTTTAGSSTLTGAFTYTTTTPPAPTLTSISPTSGSTAGGTAVTLTGTNFAAGATVTVGGASATSVVVSSATRITAVTPAGTAGARDVRVTVSGQSATLTGGFTYTTSTSPAPTLSAISPASGPVAGGTAVTLTGTNFAAGATVTVGGASATSVVVVSATSLTAVTPAGTAGARDVRVTVSGQSATLTGGFTYTSGAGTDGDGDGLPTDWETLYGLDPNSGAGVNGASGDPDGDGLTNQAEYQAGSHPRGTHKRYLAEGVSNAFFSTRFAVANPQATVARVLLSFTDTDGRTTRHYVSVPARTRATVDTAAIAALNGASFATQLEADQVVVMDRLVSWSGSAYAAQMETAVERPSTTWYLAEGATHGMFDLFYLVQNPNATASNLRVRFLTPSGQQIIKTYTVGAYSRFTIWVDNEVQALRATDVSAEITSTNNVPVIVERSMYLNSNANKAFKGGHNSAGVTAPATSWFLAEGSTGSFFSTFILLANPNSTAATVRGTYLLPSGAPIVKTYTVAPNSRQTLNVSGEHASLQNASVSIKFESTNGVPIIVERTMWWVGRNGRWTEGHNAFGATQTAPRWVVAEGEAGGARGVSTFVLIANTSSAAADVRVTLLRESGAEESRTYTVGANARYTVGVGDAFPSAVGQRFSVVVESLNPTVARDLVVERAMYWNTDEDMWGAGSASTGAIVP